MVIACKKRRLRTTDKGFTLLGLLLAMTIAALVGALCVGEYRSTYSKCCLKAVVFDIVGMYKEAKALALGESDYALVVDPGTGKIALHSSYGEDGKWNTGDDMVVRSFRLADKGGNLRFGYGSYGPIKNHAKTATGIAFSFGCNYLLVNDRLTGYSGTVYLMSPHGAAMAVVVNSTDTGCSIYRWNERKSWVKM